MLTEADVVSHRFKFEQIADVYKRFNEKAGGIEKVFLEVRDRGTDASLLMTLKDQVRSASSRRTGSPDRCLVGCLSSVYD